MGGPHEPRPATAGGALVGGSRVGSDPLDLRSLWLCEPRDSTDRDAVPRVWFQRARRLRAANRQPGEEPKERTHEDGEGD